MTDTSDADEARTDDASGAGTVPSGDAADTEAGDDAAGADTEAGDDADAPPGGRAPGVAFRNDLRRAAREGEDAPGAAFE